MCLEDADDNRYQDRAAARRDMKGEYDALAAAGLRVSPVLNIVVRMKEPQFAPVVISRHSGKQW